ncbi:MAG: serine hydrolase [Dehalococcoidales bacterium]|nr:MAG: serine hydrolase [Dehalococcoidales bacterium]
MMAESGKESMNTAKSPSVDQREPRRRPGMNTRRHVRAMAAAYKAMYYCSGIFTAGHTTERIEADVFTGVSPVWESLFPEMPAEIDERNKTVAVTYLPDMPPRIAAWRPGLGSTQLPIGATLDAVKYLPRLPEDLIIPNTDDEPWPQGDKEAAVTLPSPQADALERVVKNAFDGEVYGGITWGVVIVKDGRIISERYDESRGYDIHTPHRTNSAAKGFAVSVVGAAVKQGLMDIYKKAPLPEWRTPGDPRRQITTNDLLHMCSGLYTERAGNPQQELYFGGVAATERSVVNIVDCMPGKRWVYAGSDTILAVRAVRTAIRDDARFHLFPFQELFWKIGMTRTTTETDWNGDFLMSGQAWSTARDFARFGILYLNDGVWNGERILPEGWSKYVATPAPDQPNMPDGRGYGAQFWLFGPEQGLPEGVYTAAGARGQYSMIIPSRNVVIVRRGFDIMDEQGQSGFRLTRFVSDVLKALETPA